MWFHDPDLTLQGLLAILVGLAVGAIVSIGFHADVVETSPARCQDRVVALSVSNTCPKGTFLELESDGRGETYVVCHCEQPTKLIIQMSPSLEPPDEPMPFVLPTPKAYPPSGPIEL